MRKSEKLAEDRVSVWLTAVMHYSRMQRKARNFPVSSLWFQDFPVSSLWFQGYGALAGFNAYVFSEGNRQSGKFAWNRRRLSIM
ncbi:hypothetical protein DWH53_19400 [Escherichia coli]|nr:hypothetical protein [Escherichia coli]RAY01564.1 hypothetical protein CCZ11_04790 [Escherichia coli]RAY06958.1 hypothetical protein CCZ08_07350 [Escherichia coli]